VVGSAEPDGEGLAVAGGGGAMACWTSSWITWVS
jgi:hypothetical protein